MFAHVLSFVWTISAFKKPKEWYLSCLSICSTFSHIRGNTYTNIIARAQRTNMRTNRILIYTAEFLIAESDLSICESADLFPDRWLQGRFSILLYRLLCLFVPITAELRRIFCETDRHVLTLFLVLFHEM